MNSKFKIEIYGFESNCSKLVKLLHITNYTRFNYEACARNRADIPQNRNSSCDFQFRSKEENVFGAGASCSSFYKHSKHASKCWDSPKQSPNFCYGATQPPHKDLQVWAEHLQQQNNKQFSLHPGINVLIDTLHFFISRAPPNALCYISLEIN